MVRRRRHDLTRRRWAATVLSLATLAGCGDSGPPRVPLVPAAGKVVVDGRPAAGVEVRFRPAESPDSLDALVPFARTGDDGGFELGTYEKGDGAPTGRYKVTLFWPDRPPGPQPGEDLLGGVYTTPERSTLEATIGEGPTTIPSFEITKPPPRPKKPSKRRNQPIDNDAVE